MDNGAAAAVGALHDASVQGERRQFVLNVGNMHTLGYVLESRRILALFEHHTGEVEPSRIAEMVGELQADTLTHEAVFESQGHGTLYLETGPFETALPVVTGPRRGIVQPYLADSVSAAPHGDMMISGCLGLLEGFAYRVPVAREHVAMLSK
jgi:uncharacterized protein (DUF1786 family)